MGRHNGTPSPGDHRHCPFELQICFPQQRNLFVASVVFLFVNRDLEIERVESDSLSPCCLTPVCFLPPSPEPPSPPTLFPPNRNITGLKAPIYSIITPYGILQLLKRNCNNLYAAAIKAGSAVEWLYDARPAAAAALITRTGPDDFVNAIRSVLVAAFCVLFVQWIQGRVWGLGSGVWGLGSGVWGPGSGVWGLGSGVWAPGSSVWGLGCRVCSLGSWVWSLGFRVQCLGFGVQGLGSGVPRSGFRVRGSGVENQVVSHTPPSETPI